MKKKKIKFIYDIFDFLYGEPKGFLQKSVKKAQIKIINKSNGTIICTEERKQQIQESNPKNLVVIHNSPSSFQLGDFDYNISNNEKVKIVYVGILQDYRLLKEVAEAISNSKNFELHIGGFGKYETLFKKMANDYDNIFFYGRLSYEKTLSLENQCDIMLCIYDPSIENHRFAAPNKFYEGLMLGKPLVMVKNTGMSKVVKENNIGVLIDYSKEGFLEGVTLLSKNKHLWNSMSDKMKDIYNKDYSWTKMQERLINFYDKIKKRSEIL